MAQHIPTGLGPQSIDHEAGSRQEGSNSFSGLDGGSGGSAGKGAPISTLRRLPNAGEQSADGHDSDRRAADKINLQGHPVGQPGELPSELDEFKHGKYVRQHISEFGQVIAIAIFLFAAFSAYKGGSLGDTFAYTVVGAMFLAACRFLPRLMLPVWHSWMLLGWVLEITTTPLILGAAWLIVVVPIGLLLKALGIQVMDLSFKAPVDSYWKVRDRKLDDFKLLERQF